MQDMHKFEKAKQEFSEELQRMSNELHQKQTELKESIEENEKMRSEIKEREAKIRENDRKKPLLESEIRKISLEQAKLNEEVRKIADTHTHSLYEAGVKGVKDPKKY